MFGSLVILYLFCGGAAGGSFLVMSAWSIAFHRKKESKSPRFIRAFKTLRSRCYTIGLIVLAFSILCLLWDLEYPEKALYLFSRPRLTALTVGAYLLFIELIIGMLLTVGNLFHFAFLGGTIRKLLEYVCCLCSIGIMIYTGVFLAGNASIPFWNTWTLVVLFFFSSLSAGISLVLLIDYFIQDQTLLLRAARPLQKTHLACLTLESATLALFLGAAFSNPAASKSISVLMEPDMLATMSIGVVGMGILTPFFFESYSLLSKECRTIPVADAVCLLGGLILRYGIIQCGVH